MEDRLQPKGREEVVVSRIRVAEAPAMVRRRSGPRQPRPGTMGVYFIKGSFIGIEVDAVRVTVTCHGSVGVMGVLSWTDIAYSF